MGSDKTIYGYTEQHAGLGKKNHVHVCGKSREREVKWDPATWLSHLVNEIERFVERVKHTGHEGHREPIGKEKKRGRDWSSDQQQIR